MAGTNPTRFMTLTTLSFADLIAMREELRRLLAMSRLSVFPFPFDEPDFVGFEEKLVEVVLEIKNRLI
jgi:hypothetical protein